MVGGFCPVPAARGGASVCISRIRVSPQRLEIAAACDPGVTRSCRGS
jgi:hypothetical protein